MAERHVLEKVAHRLVAGALLTLPRQCVSGRKRNRLDPFGDSQPRRLGLDAGCRRAHYPLGTLTVVARNDGILPLDLYAAAHLFQRYAGRIPATRCGRSLPI